MIKNSTISVKIKTTKAINIWFSEQSKKAVELYNQCLTLQFERVDNCKQIYTSFDLAKQFRSNTLASDYKDRIFERIASSIDKWINSETLRYEIYWNHKTKSKIQDHKNKFKIFEKLPYIKKVLEEIELRNNYRKHIISLLRKQKLHGKPRKRKTCSLAFSIRKNRQKTIQIKRNKIEFSVPKFKKQTVGKYNFLPTTADYQFKLATLKMDRCGTLWIKLTVEENLLCPTQNENLIPQKEKILVGVDMGLKTTRTAVSVNELSSEIVEVYSPERQRFFDQSYNALVWASNRDKRHLPFVHRKIVRRRHDSIGKDIVKILSMGDIFKFGKPNAAFLLSGRLARSAADAANSMFLTRFVKRAELAEKEAGEVNEAYTSVTCRKCGNEKPMPLSVRTYECIFCEHKEDRDVNSAYQIAFRNFLSDDDNVQNKWQKKQTKRRAFPPCNETYCRDAIREFSSEDPFTSSSRLRASGV